MTAIADLISRTDRDRLLARLAEWRDLADTMRKPGGMPAVPAPKPLHRMAQRRQRDNDDDTATTGGQRP